MKKPILFNLAPPALNPARESDHKGIRDFSSKFNNAIPTHGYTVVLADCDYGLSKQDARDDVEWTSDDFKGFFSNVANANTAALTTFIVFLHDRQIEVHSMSCHNPLPLLDIFLQVCRAAWKLVMGGFAAGEEHGTLCIWSKPNVKSMGGNRLTQNFECFLIFFFRYIIFFILHANEDICNLSYFVKPRRGDQSRAL